MTDRSTAPITLSTKLYDNVGDFIERNELPQDGSYYADTDRGILSFQAFASKPDDPEGYVFSYDSDACSVKLPAGRYIQIGYAGAYFYDASSTLPLEPVPFKEAVALAEEIHNSLVGAGWTVKDYDPEVTAQSLAEYSGGLPQHFYANLFGCGSEEFTVQLTIKYYNALPPGPSIPPVPGNSLPEEFPDRYIIEVLFSANPDEAYALRDARRIEVAGNKDDLIPLTVWLKDPHWKPAGWQGKFIK
jgi:hypothetical protein